MVELVSAARGAGDEVPARPARRVQERPRRGHDARAAARPELLRLEQQQRQEHLGPRRRAPQRWRSPPKQWMQVRPQVEAADALFVSSLRFAKGFKRFNS